MKNLINWFSTNNYTQVTPEAIKQLSDQFGVKTKEYEDGLFVFNYDQINSPKTNPVVMDCRGIILDYDLNPVCVPFTRFFNLGEAPEITGEFNINNAVCYSKVDGSLIKVYYYNNTWCAGTRGTAFAESDNYTGTSFYELVMDAFGVSGELFTETLDSLDYDKNCTYLFEYTSPKNRVVTPYSEDKMYFLGKINNKTGEETRLVDEVRDTVGVLNVAFPEKYDINDIDKLKAFVNSLPSLQEGVVAHDLVSNVRVKVKADLYLIAHKLRGDSLPTPKRIAELIVTNEYDEYLAYFPDDKQLFEPTINAFVDMIEEVNRVYLEVQGIEDKKEYALKVKDYSFSHLLFGIKGKDMSVIDMFNSLNTNAKVKTLLTYMESK